MLPLTAPVRLAGRNNGPSSGLKISLKFRVTSSACRETYYGADEIMYGINKMFGKSYLVAAFALVLLAGCASQCVQQLKEESATTVGEKITKGKSSRDDVRAAFGDPHGHFVYR